MSSLNDGGVRVRAGRIFSASLRGQRYQPPGLVAVTVPIVAADFTGANSGKWVFIAPMAMEFVGAEAIWATAGTNTIRVKKVKSSATSAPGAAADANNIDISGVFTLSGSANTRVEVAPVITATAGVPANMLSQGDKVALASAAGTASLAGGLVTLYFGIV